MTQTEFDALVKGDALVRVSNGKAYVVAGTNRGITPGCNAVWARIVKNGKPYGRIYTVTLDGFDCQPAHDVQPCHLCGAECSTHPDAANPIAQCGDCGGVTCLDHRVEDAATRCNACAADFYASPQPSAATLIRIPTRFYIDHDERALPSPAIVKFTKSHFWIDANDPAVGELRDDAAFYADAAGPDQCHPSIIAGARALLVALAKGGK